MFAAAIAVASFYLAGFLVLIAAMLRAPEGFEDGEGFHTGRDSLVDAAELRDESAL